MKSSGIFFPNIDYPVCYGFPVGHVKENVALKCGAEYRLTLEERVLEEVSGWLTWMLKCKHCRC